MTEKRPKVSQSAPKMAQDGVQRSQRDVRNQSKAAKNRYRTHYEQEGREKDEQRGREPCFEEGLPSQKGIKHNGFLIILLSVRATILKSFLFLEDFIRCCPILPKQPVIAKLIFFII